MKKVEHRRALNECCVQLKLQQQLLVANLQATVTCCMTHEGAEGTTATHTVPFNAIASGS